MVQLKVKPLQQCTLHETRLNQPVNVIHCGLLLSVSQHCAAASVLSGSPRCVNGAATRAASHCHQVGRVHGVLQMVASRHRLRAFLIPAGLSAPASASRYWHGSQ